MYLSELGYSELVQRLFEKMTFFLVDPLNMVLSCIMNYEMIMQDMAENCLNLRGREEGSLISRKKVSRAPTPKNVGTLI
jgi:hypothetical protein